MGVLDEGGNRRRGWGSFGVNFGRPIITNRVFIAIPEVELLMADEDGETTCRVATVMERSMNNARSGIAVSLQVISLLLLSPTLKSIQWLLSHSWLQLGSPLTDYCPTHTPCVAVGNKTVTLLL